jgi:hypothetical protein
MAPDQKTDDENSTASDPNLVGRQETQRVRDDRAGKMTPSDEYNHNEPFRKI